MNDISVIQNIPDILRTGKTLFEILKNIGSNDVIAGVGTIMGITGYSLRDLAGKIKMGNFVNKFKEEFKEVNSIDNDQDKILFDGFIELEDYIKNCENLDQNVFEEISNLLINGVKNKDILTREYIKLLKKMSWVDLKILIECKKIETHKESSAQGDCKLFKKMTFIEWRELRKIGVEELKKIEFPKELIDLSLDKLKNMYLFNQDGLCFDCKINYKERFSSYSLNVKIRFLSDLGLGMVNLINNKGEQN